MINQLTNENVDDILKSDRTFMIVFYSEKIPNLPNLLEVFEEFDEQFKGKIDIYKCEIDTAHGKLAKYFAMSAVPAMVMMKNNKPYANVAGAVSATQYRSAVKEGIMKIMNEV